MLRRAILTLLLSLCCLAAAQGPDLVIAFQGGATTLDPMMRNETTAMTWQRHMFDNLAAYDRQGKIQPWIATGWENVDSTTWRITVRQGVTFHDGTPMTAQDVAYSIMRAATHPRSEMRGEVGGIVGANVIDDETVEVLTGDPDPLLPEHLNAVRVVPEALLESMGEQAFAESPVGTGPYAFVSWLAEDHLNLQVYPGFWGDPPAFERVRLEVIPSGATRVAALLSGEIDIAVEVLPQDLPRVEASPDAYVTQVPGLRLIYLAMDHVREDTPGMREPNPFLDLRVRQAVFHAIDMDLIASRVMSGVSTPAPQFYAPFNEGFDPTLERLPYDPERARQLLADAGYADGFAVRFDAPNDRYLNDALIAQAIGGMLRDVGLDVEVNAVPRAVFFGEHFNTGNSTMAMSGWASFDTGNTLLSIFHCWDEGAGLGRFNPFWYCNPEVDEMILEARNIFDPAARSAAFAEIMRKAQVEDVAYVPLHYQNEVAAVRTGLNFEMRADGYVFATEVTPAD